MIVEQYILIVRLYREPGTGLFSVSNKLQYPKYLHHKLLH